MEMVRANLDDDAAALAMDQMAHTRGTLGT